MRKRILILALAAVMGATCAMAEKFVKVLKNGVNLREQPNTSSSVVGKASKGVKLIALGSSGGWTHVRDVVEGKEAYVSSSLVRVVPDYSKPDSETLLGQKDGEIGYEKRQTGKSSETISLWRFWRKAPNSNVVEACLSVTYNDVMGRSQTNDSYYRGVIKPYCLVLTESTDYEGGNAEKLESPMVIYSEASEQSGIYVDGEFYRDQDSM